MHRSIGLVLIVPIALASEANTNEVADKLAERVLGMRLIELSGMDAAMLAKSYPSKIHGTRHLRPMPPGRSLFPMPHAPVSSLLQVYPALQIPRALGEHQSDVGATDRRQLISGLAATAAAASIQVTAQALAADNLERFQLQQELAVLDKLVGILAGEIADLKVATERAAGFIKAVNEKGAGPEKQKAIEAEQTLAVDLTFAATIANTAVRTSVKVQSLAAQEVTRADIQGSAKGNEVKDLQDAAGTAKAKIEQVEAALKSALAYATASAKALPQITEEKKKGEKKKVEDDRAALAVAVSAAGKAQIQIATAEAKLSEATLLICKAPTYCAVFDGF